MSPLVAAFLRSTVLPAALAAIVVFFSGQWRESLRTRVQAICFALMFGLGNYLLIDRLSFPPADASDSLSLVALMLAVFVFVAPTGVGRRYLVRGVFVVAVGVAVLWHLRAQLLDSSVNQRNLVAFLCLGLGLWSIIERAQYQASILSLILLPMISFSGASVLLLLSGSASLSQLATVVCGLLGAALVMAWIFPKRISIEAVLPFASVFLVAFLVVGHFYLDINPWRLIVLAWPFVPLWGRGWLPKISSPVVEAASLTVLAVGPVGYLLWVVFQSSGPLY